MLGHDGSSLLVSGEHGVLLPWLLTTCTNRIDDVMVVMVVDVWRCPIVNQTYHPM